MMIGRVVPEICSRTDRQTRLSQYSGSRTGGAVVKGVHVIALTDLNYTYSSIHSNDTVVRETTEFGISHKTM